jgi:hypothetical protein
MNTPLPTTIKYLGNEGEDPTAPWWASGNYVGPNWSDGKEQESVLWGEKPALHALDELARRHDAAYAHYKDEKHREAADMLFAEEAKKLKQKYGSKWAEDPQIAARMVEYGNHTRRQINSLAKAGTLGPAALPWLIYKSVSNMVDNHKRIKGTYLTKEVGDIRRFYETDPKKGQVQQTIATESSKKRPGWTGPTVDLVTRSDTSQAREASQSVKPAAPAQKAGPTATLIHNAESIEGQRRRFANYKALHQAAHKQPARKILKNKNRVATTFGFNRPTEAVPFSEVQGKKKNKKNAVRPL